MVILIMPSSLQRMSRCFNTSMKVGYEYALNDHPQLNQKMPAKAKRKLIGKSPSSSVPQSLPPIPTKTLPPINTGKEYIRTCVKCEVLIEGSVYFCPHCGSAVLDNILMKSHTTADYDPTSRLLKPWREQVIVPPRVPIRDLTFKNVSSIMFVFLNPSLDRLCFVYSLY